jgi:hypothetical protein
MRSSLVKFGLILLVGHLALLGAAVVMFATG